MLLWADAPAYNDIVVIPMVRKSWSRSSLEFIGLEETLPFPVPALGDYPGEVSEEQDLLFLHLRLFISHLGQLIAFAFLHQGPLFEWVRLLDERPSIKRCILARMRTFWELVQTLEESSVRLELGFAKQLHFKVALIDSSGRSVGLWVAGRFSLCDSALIPNAPKVLLGSVE